MADGYRPSRLVLHQSPAQNSFYAEDPLPATYDLTALNRVSPVKDQGTSGACWAFSAIGSLESGLLPLQPADFSENNLKNESGFDPDPNSGGGNNDMAIAYLARWNGPLLETDDPFDPGSTTSVTETQAQVHVQDVIALARRTGPTDNDAIKRAIMDYGAVSVSMYMGGQNTSQIAAGATTSYFSSVAATPNHAVLLVGWIDGRPAADFTDYDSGNAVPSGDGAFIVKNSYGTDWGADGYFYISYYDVNLAKDNCFVYPAAEPVINYAVNYQYDLLGYTGSASYGGDIWMANIYTKQTEDGDLAAVSFYNLQTDTTYRVYVIEDFLSSADLDAGRTLAATGTLADCGYFTVDLDAPVSIQPGHQFAVVVQLTSAGASYAPIEQAVSNYSSAATAHTGESFVSYDGSSWQDLTTVIPSANLCLKAFTLSRTVVEYTDPVTGLIVDLATGTIIGHTGSPADLIIPAMINDIAITAIGYEALADCTELESVSLPDTVGIIGDNAFRGCISLNQVNFAGNCPSIAADAFSNTASSLKLYYHIAYAASWSVYTGYPTQAYCLLKLDLLDGTPPVSLITDVVDGKISPPSAPSRLHHAFAGWYHDAELNTPWDFASDVVIADLTLYARWTVNQYTVRFVDWDGSELKIEQVEYNQSATPPTDPVREGYMFTGWSQSFDQVSGDLEIMAVYSEARVFSSSLLIRYEKSLIGPLAAGTTVSQLLQQITNDPAHLVFKDRAGTIITDPAVTLATGMTVMIADQPSSVLTMVIKGDLTGDGAVSALDLLQLKKYLLGQISLDGAFLESALVTGNANPSALDLLQIKKHLLGQISIQLLQTSPAVISQ